MSALADTIYRLSPAFAQNLTVSWYGRKTRRERFGQAFDRMTDLLERSERWSAGEMRAYQDERVASIVAHAYETVPFYRERMDALRLRPADVRTAADLPLLPILTRADVTANAPRLVSRAIPRRDRWSAWTSGTTGSPTPVWWDRDVVAAANACLWRARRWAGVEFGRPYATLFGRLVVPPRETRPPYWRVNRPWRQLLLSPVHLSEATAPLYLAAVADFGAESLETYPSSAYLLARYAQAAGARLALRAVFTTSEPLLPEQRAAVEDAFGCRVFDFYSQAERVGFSSECGEHNGHHLHEEYGVTELVDDGGAPVASGATGRVVATTLHNRAMPLIRYAVGDATAMTGRRCPCGRTLPLTEGVATKQEDLLVASDGRLVPPSVLAGVFKRSTPVSRSQIVQRDAGEVTVRIVRLVGYTRDDERAIEQGFRARLGSGLRVRFEYVEDISVSSRGKYRWIVSTAPHRWGCRSGA
jgi:phenylacetate-CoA ligase